MNIKALCKFCELVLVAGIIVGIFSGAGYAASNTATDYAPMQTAIKQAIANGNFSLPDIAGSPEYNLTVEKNDTHIKVVSTTKITFKNPKGAGYGNSKVFGSNKKIAWPKIQGHDPKNANAVIDYDQQIKSAILAQINSIPDRAERTKMLEAWRNNNYETGARTFEIKETYEATSAPSDPPSSSTNHPSSSLNDPPIVMGFTNHGHVNYTYANSVSIPMFLWSYWLANYNLNVTVDDAYGLRLPTNVTFLTPSAVTTGSYYYPYTSIVGENWSAAQYAAANVPPENGDAFVARANFLLTLQAQIRGVGNVGPVSLNKGVDYGKSFPTPIGSNQQFPIQPLNLTPQQTRLWVCAPSCNNPIGDLWAGIGLQLDPKLTSDKITANWTATGDATGAGQVRYSQPYTYYSLGPIPPRAGTTPGKAYVSLSDYNYYFSVCKVNLNANVQGGVDIIGFSASIGMPYIPIYSYDCSGMTGGLHLGTHVTYYNGAPIAKTTANSITGFSMVTI